MAPAVKFGNVQRPAPAKQLTEAEAAALFDATAKLYLNVSGAEFLRRWDGGEYRDSTDCMNRVMHVAALIPLVRRERARKNSTTRAR